MTLNHEYQRINKEPDNDHNSLNCMCEEINKELQSTYSNTNYAHE